MAVTAGVVGYAYVIACVPSLYMSTQESRAATLYRTHSFQDIQRKLVRCPICWAIATKDVCYFSTEGYSCLPLQYLVKRIYNLLEVLSLDVNINTGGVDARVSQQFLDGKDVNP